MIALLLAGRKVRTPLPQLSASGFLSSAIRLAESWLPEVAVAGQRLTAAEYKVNNSCS